MKEILNIDNLFASANEKEILKGLNLKINSGEIHVIMGPNGAGKSTLANVILNNPKYHKTSGNIIYDGENINNLSTDEIAKKGIFMSFQSPIEIQGITVANFLKSINSKKDSEKINLFKFAKLIEGYTDELNINKKMLNRNFNVGFSGGEKKKNEILQMLVMKPKLAILDETDSGLDVDAIKTVSKGIEMYKNSDNAVLIITHSTKILENLCVQYVHILIDGKIVKTGNIDLAYEIEKYGYEKFKNEE